MFKTITSAAAGTTQDQDAARAHGREGAARVAPASRRAALGGNYAAVFGGPQAGHGALHAAVPCPASGHGYTARFDGNADRNASAPVDSYTAVFGPDALSAPGSANPAAWRSSYTDANL